MSLGFYEYGGRQEATIGICLGVVGTEREWRKVRRRMNCSPSLRNFVGGWSKRLEHGGRANCRCGCEGVVVSQVRRSIDKSSPDLTLTVTGEGYEGDILAFRVD